MQNDPYKNAPHGILKGFIIMCDLKREKNAIKEAYNFLNEEMEVLYPNIQPRKDLVIKELEPKNKKQKQEEQPADAPKPNEETKATDTENAHKDEPQDTQSKTNDQKTDASQGNLVEDQLNKELQ